MKVYGPLELAGAEVLSSLPITDLFEGRFVVVSGAYYYYTSGVWEGLATISAGVLPPQAGNAGKILTTDGNTAAWEEQYPDDSGDAGKFLQTDGSGNVSWEDPPASLPAQAGHAGEYLQTDGTNVSWQTVDALPDQTGEAGKFLFTDGSVATWETVDALPDQSSAAGKYLTSDGTDASWEDLRLGLYASTTKISGGALSINADPTKFDLSAGTGRWVDYSTPTLPVINEISWSAQTAQTVTNLATADITYILINSAGSIVQQTTYPSQAERRDNIFIGRLNHANRTVISFADNIGDAAQSLGNQFGDFVDAMGPFSVSGNTPSTLGATLTFQKSAGTMFSRYYQQTTTPKNPHVVSLTATSPVSFGYRTQTGVSGVTGTAVDPTMYDVGGVVTAVGGSGSTATVQRIFLFPSNNVRIQYGQTTYSNLSNALAGIPTETFITNPSIAGFAILIGYIVVQRNCTALDDTNRCRILPAARFDAGSGGGALATTTLQTAYNNSTIPQIGLNSTQGALTIRDNATPLTGDLFAIQNDAGSTGYFHVDVQGVKGSNFATALRALITDSNGAVGTSAVTSTQLGYLSSAAGTTGTGPSNLVYSDSPTITSPTIDNGSSWMHETSVTTPSSGRMKVFAKSDNQIYITDPNGYEYRSRGPDGFGNALDLSGNADYGMGLWTTYADAAGTTPVDGTGGSPNITYTRNTTTPLSGAADFKFSKDAVNRQGQGASIAFSIKTVDISKKLQIIVDVNATAANYAASDLGIYIYDVTNSTLITPSVASLPKIKDTWVINFMSSTSTSYRLIIHQASTSALAYDIYFDNFVINGGNTAQGPAWSGDVAYTPSSSITNAAGQFSYTRFGDKMLVGGTIKWSNTGSMVNLTPAQLFPSGLTYKALTDSGPSLGAGKFNLGNAEMEDFGTQSYNGFLIGTYTDASNAFTALTFTNVLTSATAPFTPAANDVVTFSCWLRVNEWAGNGTVNLGQGAQVEYAWNSDTTDASTTASGFSYGSGGVVFGSFSTTNRIKRIRFQYPVQEGDEVILQLFDSAGGRWIDSSQTLGLSTSSTTGITVAPVNSTDFDLTFGSAGYIATTRSSASAWAGIAGQWKWRLVKRTPSAPVGFGLAGTDGSSGLVNPYTVGSGVIYSGNFTSTLANGTNVTSSSFTSASYTRVGKIVTGTIRFTASLTSASTNSIVTATLPVPSNFTASSDARGVINVRNGSSLGVGGYVEADVGDLLVILFQGPSTVGNEVNVSFQYEIK